MKMAKRTLSIVLALIMALGVFTLAASAEGPADYSALNAVIISTADREFYTVEANTLIDQVINQINWELTSEDQATVDGYVTMVNDLNTFINTKITAAPESPLTFDYGTDFSVTPVYPYGTDGLAFYPFRAEEKAVNTIELKANKTVVPQSAWTNLEGEQTFTVTLSIGSNALICAAGIPVLFDKTRLELVGVDNSLNNVTVTPTMIGTNLASEYTFSTTLNPGQSSFWPEVYKNDAVFQAQWAGINISMSSNLDGAPATAPYSVKPVGQENVLSLVFKVKAGAPAGEAKVYVDPNFKRDAYNKGNSLYFGRAKDENSWVTYDALSTYGATVDVSKAVASVEIVDVVLGDVTGDGKVTGRDAQAVLKYVAEINGLTDKQKLAADVVGFGTITARDAKKILMVVAELDPPFPS